MPRIRGWMRLTPWCVPCPPRWRNWRDTRPAAVLCPTDKPRRRRSLNARREVRNLCGLSRGLVEMLETGGHTMRRTLLSTLVVALLLGLSWTALALGTRPAGTSGPHVAGRFQIVNPTPNYRGETMLLDTAT